MGMQGNHVNFGGQVERVEWTKWIHLIEYQSAATSRVESAAVVAVYVSLGGNFETLKQAGLRLFGFLPIG